MDIARERESWIRENRLFDFRKETGDFYFEVFFRKHILAERVSFFRDFVQQMGVYVRADPETENASMAFAALFDAGDNLVLIGGADGWAAIREKDDYEWARVSVGGRVLSVE